MAITDEDRLRSMLGEEIPSGGTEEDTLFTSEKVVDLLTAAGGDLNQASVAGWRLKAAHFANLVNVTEGNSSRAMSDLHTNALAMAAHYQKASDGTPEGVGGRVVIGTIQGRQY